MPPPTFTLNLDRHSARHATRLLKKGKPWSKPRFGPVPWRSLGIRVAVIGVLFAFVATSSHFYGVGKVEGIKSAEALAYESVPSYDLTTEELQSVLREGGWQIRQTGRGNIIEVGKHGTSFITQVLPRGFSLVYRHWDHGALPYKALNDFNARYKWASLRRTNPDFLLLKYEVVARGGMMPNAIHHNFRTFHALINNFNEWVADNRDSDWGGDFAIQKFNMDDLTTYLERDGLDYKVMDGGFVVLNFDGNTIIVEPIKDLGLHFTFKFLDFGVLTDGHLNAWNETQPWTTLSRWDDDAVGLKRDVVIEGGVTENNISANLAAFQVMVERLKKLVTAVGRDTSKRIEKT